MLNFSKILIANRGEIARRIIRTAREMDYKCAVIYSSGEINADFVSEADEAYDLGNGNIHETYLNITKIIDIALRNGIQAIHPGYGFLSENYKFAKACEENNIVFIGPTSENIKLMSQKTAAREFVKSLGIPLLESVQGNSPEELLKKSGKLKYPVIVKADTGGGGKGMQIVKKPEELSKILEISQREALAYFGDSNVYLEEYLEYPRHIEVQILGDCYGNIIHLYERECTIQRRHQKIIEEAPSLCLSDNLRNKLLEASLTIARKMKYLNAGTIEFLVDENQNFYFLEMNTRIQVEHPVTEKITGIDLVREQLNIASGNRLNFKQEDISVNGHAIESRIYAENPFNEFLPSVGSVIKYQEPTGRSVRIDSALSGPALISSDFDPMIAKVISGDLNRESARLNLIRFLQQYIIHGIDTNIPYLIEILNNPGFIQNSYSTSFCKDSKNMLQASYIKKMHGLSIELITAAFLIFTFPFLINHVNTNDNRVWKSLGYWRNIMVTEINILDVNYNITFKKQGTDNFTFCINEKVPLLVKGREKNGRVDFLFSGQRHVAFISSLSDIYYLSINGNTYTIRRNDITKTKFVKESGLNSFNQQNKILATINGKIIKMNVKMNEKVNKGDILMVVESMKMENYILAPKGGKITNICVNTGDLVKGRDVLAILT